MNVGDRAYIRTNDGPYGPCEYIGESLDPPNPGFIYHFKFETGIEFYVHPTGLDRVEWLLIPQNVI